MMTILKQSAAKKLLSAILISLMISACGGGGGGSTTTPTTPPSGGNNNGGGNNSGGDNNGGNGGNTATTLDEQYGLYLASLVNNHIMPGYQLLAENADSFVQSSNTFCSNPQPDQVALSLLQLSWLELNLQWQTVQWINLGPVTKQNRNLRLQFWPDSQNAVGVGLSNLLAHEETVDAEYVAAHNVGGQGIPALERLLFASNDSGNLITAENRNKQCEVLQAIATNIKNISDEIHLVWQTEGEDYANQVISGTGSFEDREQVMSELVTNWLVQLENVKDEKILKPLGDSTPGEKERAEFYRSSASLAAIKINLNIFKTIYTGADGHGLDDILESHLEQSNINSSMLETLEAIITQVDALQGTLEELIIDDAQRPQLQALITAMQDFRTVLTADFVQALDIYIGFNSNDGD